MDLEKLNNEYAKLKNNLEKVGNDIKALESKANDLANDKKVYEGKLIEAERNNNLGAKKAFEDEIKKTEAAIEQVKQATLKKKESITKLQAQIDNRVNAIKENPEMKKHLDEVMAKKYTRKISKLTKEKEEAVEKKDKLTNLKQLVEEHPTCGNNLKGILRATKDIKDLESELDSLKVTNNGTVQYSDPARADEITNTLIPQMKAKLQTNKTSLMAYMAKQNLNITEKDIEELANNGFETDKNGEINLNMVMDKSISKANRQIKGYDKSIKNHQIALDKVSDEKTIDSDSEPEQTTSNESKPGKFKSFMNNFLFTDEEVEEEVEEEFEEEVEEETEQDKPKWYQFIQRFKNWNERRKQKALPEQSQEEPEQEEPKPENQFRDSLKYDIVRNIVEQKEKEELKEAKKERKSEEINMDEER